MFAGGSKPLLASAIAGMLFAAPAFADPANDGSGSAAPAAATADMSPVTDYIDYGAWGRSQTDPAKAAIAAELGNAVETGILSKRDAKEITGFYAGGNFAPAWTADGKLDDAALALMARIAQADTDGLDPADFPLPDKDIGVNLPASPTELADADILLSQAVAAYARTAYAGRVNPGDVSKNYGYEVHPPAAGDVLALVSQSDDPVATLAAYNPPQKEFADLRAELGRIREASADRHAAGGAGRRADQAGDERSAPAGDPRQAGSAGGDDRSRRL